MEHGLGRHFSWLLDSKSKSKGFSTWSLEAPVLRTCEKAVLGVFKGQAAERILLGDGRGLIDHLVCTAQPNFRTSRIRKRRMRVWRETFDATGGGKASAGIDHDEANQEAAQFDGLATSSHLMFLTAFNSADETLQTHATLNNISLEATPANKVPPAFSHLTSSMVSGGVDEVSAMSGFDASFPRAPAELSTKSNSPLQGNAASIKQKLISDSSLIDSFVPTCKKCDTTADGDPILPPLPSPMSRGSSPASDLPSLDNRNSSLPTEDIGEPTPWARPPDHDNESPTPFQTSALTSNVPSFDSQATAARDTRSPHPFFIRLAVERDSLLRLIASLLRLQDRTIDIRHIEAD